MTTPKTPEIAATPEAQPAPPAASPAPKTAPKNKAQPMKPGKTAKVSAVAKPKAKAAIPAKKTAPQKAAPKKAALKQKAETKPVAPKPVSPAPAKTKLKLVRDSFTMPKADFDLIEVLKERALGSKRPTKKSELLRAGLHALLALNNTQLLARLGQLSELKPGRPKKVV